VVIFNGKNDYTLLKEDKNMKIMHFSGYYYLKLKIEKIKKLRGLQRTFFPY
jgi:hypothetical protein